MTVEDFEDLCVKLNEAKFSRILHSKSFASLVSKIRQREDSSWWYKCVELLYETAKLAANSEPK